jgi:hypothetical protein
MLGGKMLENKKQQKAIAEDMKCVKRVIRMFAPGYDVTGTAARRRRRHNPYFSRGTVYREALNAPREADGGVDDAGGVLAHSRRRGSRTRR